MELAGEQWNVGVYMLNDVHARLDNWSVQLALVEEKTYSPSFQATDGSRWQICFDSSLTDFVGLHLVRVDARLPGQLVNFSITLHNHLNMSQARVKYSNGPRRYEWPTNTRGWSEFISVADLEAAGFVQDGSLSVSARVEMIPRDKLRLELRRENVTASPLLTNLSITLIDGAAPQQNADNVENFQPLSNVDSIRRFSGARNHQFRPGSQEASVWMDADRLNEKGTSFFGDGSLLVMVGMQFQPVIEGTDEGSSAGADAPAIDTPGDLASMRVSELQHLLDQTSSKCHA